MAQADSIVPDDVQGYDRYAYANHNPVLYNDPSGHVSCTGSNWEDGPQCKGKGDSKDQYDIWKRPKNFTPQDLAHRLYLRQGGSTVHWAGLTSDQQSVLVQAGFSEGSYNDYLEGGASPADMWHDPLTYIEAAVGGGGLIRAGIGLLTASAANDAASTWDFPSNGPVTQDGLTYSIHAMERMMPEGLGGRGIPPSVVQNAVAFGTSSATEDESVVKLVFENVTVIYNQVTNTVVTVWKTGH